MPTYKADPSKWMRCPHGIRMRKTSKTASHCYDCTLIYNRDSNRDWKRRKKLAIKIDRSRYCETFTES